MFYPEIFRKFAMTKSTKIKLTQAIIRKALENRSEPHIFRDTEVPGLLLRVGPRSTSFYLDYKPTGRRPDGRQHPSQSVKIGTPASHSLAEARQEAARIKVKVASGIDPAAEKKAAKAARALAEARKETLEEAAEAYISIGLFGSEKHVRTEASNLRLAINEMGLGGATPNEVSVADVLKMLALSNGRARAVHRFGALSRFFDDLLAREAVASNPCSAIPKKRRPKPPQARMRYHSACEVKALWNTTGLSPVQLRLLRASLLVPLRLGELTELTLDEVDIAGGRLNLSGKRTKNGDPFSIPLPDDAKDLFVCPDPENDNRIFPLNGTGKKFQSGHSLTKRIRNGSGVVKFNFHNQRRTFSTVLADLGIGDENVADALLNHRQSSTRSGVKAAYNHSKQWPQKVYMMAAWAEILHHAVTHGEWRSGDAVTQFRPGNALAR